MMTQEEREEKEDAGDDLSEPRKPHLADYGCFRSTERYRDEDSSSGFRESPLHQGAFEAPMPQYPDRADVALVGA